MVILTPLHGFLINRPTGLALAREHSLKAAHMKKSGKPKNKMKVKRERKEEEIEYTTEEEIFLPKPISRNGQASFNN